MRRVAILADDLTGALDSAAPFASAEAPIPVVWDAAALPVGDFALDTETRPLPPEDARHRVASLLPRLRGSAIAFKKIDSLMRGNTVTELLASCRSGDFASVVIAPAFPEQGRITRGGRQFQPCDDDTLLPIDVDLAGSLARNGIDVRLVARGEGLSGAGVAICDAESEADLAGLAASARNLAGPVLWCGTAGLARALRPSPSAAVKPVGRKRLTVVGSRHPASAAQIARLRATYPGSTAIVADPVGARAAVAMIATELGAGGSGALCFALPPLDPPAAEAVFRETFSRLAAIAPPDILVIAGGDTLFQLCTVLGASSLAAIGEWMAGIAVSRFVDGAWMGTTVISKSGAFGDDDMLLRLVRHGEGSLS
jgi:uncharacterized protein YgbK (DUF1537 family)